MLTPDITTNTGTYFDMSNKIAIVLLLMPILAAGLTGLMQSWIHHHFKN